MSASKVFLLLVDAFNRQMTTINGLECMDPYPEEKWELDTVLKLSHKEKMATGHKMRFLDYKKVITRHAHPSIMYIHTNLTKC